MWKTVLFLLFTLLVVPVVTLYFDEAPNAAQWHSIMDTGVLYVLMALLCFVVSTATKNYSQVDKLWSIMPFIYAWLIFYHHTDDTRVLLMSILITLWGVRLSYNFSRRGGYQWRFWEGEEDYRWAVLRAKPEFQGKGRWMAFNLFFISLYQMGLVWLITLPVVKSIGGGPLTTWDYVLAVVLIALIVIETIADQQQWNYQNEKHRLIKEGDPLPDKYEKGFAHEGLWSLVRHPNYAAEQSIWIVVYLFSVVATGSWINWSIAGCLLLVLLFKGSADFSEAISSDKYPAYKNYIKKVPRFIPFIK